ncbi:MAG TPA: NAD(P)-dependent oxidoreductase [Candidatus Limnocylindrales bacterium]|nr:NAD(P)-dependent oxidoreductase [Candidatus Limnocylindrales bacterium]
MTTVGVLGIGRMGGAMARAINAKGHDLVLWNRTPEAAERLAAELGARTAATPREAAAAADVCLSMLADGAAVDAVFGGADGLIAGAGPSSVLIDASTVPPATLRAHADAARAAGAGLLDAPVSGSVALAEAGKLTLMVGGEAADLARARPVLDAVGATIFHLGPLGTGCAMKLAVNTVIFGLNQAVAEGLVLAEAAGIARDRAYDVIAAGAAGAPYVGYKRAAFLEPATTPVGFALDLAAKDLRLIRELADAVGVMLPQARIDLDVIEDAAGSPAIGGDRDFSTVADHLRATATKEGATG